MSWEDEELAEYEERQVAASQRSVLSTTRINLLEQHHSMEWHALRTEVLDRFHIINEKAARDITTSLTPRVTELWIRREDGVELRARYVAETKTATFSCEAHPFDELQFELTVRPVDGNDKIVWRTVSVRPDTVSREEIAKEVITNYLRAGTTF